MDKDLRVLMIEDDLDDAHFAEDALQRSGYAVTALQVDSAAALDAALTGQTWDLIICDYRMPTFSGLDALALVRGRGLDLPFILMSGTAGEEIAVEALHAGADDYIVKSNLARLGPSVQRALRAAAERRERRQAEERLTTERDLLQTLIDAIQDAIYVEDAELRFLRVNAAHARFLGAATTDELLGKCDFDYFPPDLARQFGAQERRILATGQPILNDLEDQSSFHDGRRWILASKVPLWQDGRVVGLVGISRDITALKQAEAERERFFTLSLDLLCLAGVDGYFKSVNPAFERTLGFTPEEMCAEPFLHFVHPDDQAATLAETEKLASGISTISFENRYRCKDGTYRLMLWTAIPVAEEGLIYCTARDITERKAMEERLHRQIGRISALHAIDSTIASSLDMRVTLAVFLEQVCVHLDVDAAQVLLLNSHLLTLEPAATRGFRGTRGHGPHLRVGEGHAGRAALAQRLVSAPAFATEHVVRLPLIVDEGFAAYAAAPLVARGQVRGVLAVFHRGPHAQDPEWLDFLVTLAGQVAIAIDNATLFTDLQQSNLELALAYDTTIEGWSRALDLRDRETEGHSRRVTAQTLALAEAMGVRGSELVHLRRGALLHDIGKMGVPDAILHKPGPLTKEEWVVMRKHPTNAYDLLSARAGHSLLPP